MDYEKLDENFLVLNFKGSAGQSFGAFSSKGLKLVLKGDANDYVGKGLSGATISIKLPDESNLVSNENTIFGNTVFMVLLQENFLLLAKQEKDLLLEILVQLL